MTPVQLINRICLGYQAAGIDLKAVYGQELDPEEVERNVEASGVAHIIMLEALNPTRELMDSTAGRIMEGNANIFTAAKRGPDSVEGFYSLWSILNSDGVGNYTRDVYSKKILGDLFYLHWSATQNLPSTAIKYGRIWVTEMQVEFAIGEYNG